VSIRLVCIGLESIDSGDKTLLLLVTKFMVGLCSSLKLKLKLFKGRSKSLNYSDVKN